MRQLVSVGRAVKRGASSANANDGSVRQRPKMLAARPENLAALADLCPAAGSTRFIDRRPPNFLHHAGYGQLRQSPVHGDQEGAMWNGHFQSKCLHPLFVFNQFGDLGAMCAASRQCPQRRWLGRMCCARCWQDIRAPRDPRSPGAISEVTPPLPSLRCSISTGGRGAGVISPSGSRATASVLCRRRISPGCCGAGRVGRRFPDEHGDPHLHRASSIRRGAG